MLTRLAPIARQFAITGQPTAAAPLGAGHIHESYRLTCSAAGTDSPYLLQRINTAIFPRPDRVMENIRRVTRHLAERLAAQGVTEVDRRVLTIIPARDGAPFVRTTDGVCWRLYRFIDRTHSVTSVTTPEQAATAGHAYGAFQRLLADFPAPRLHDTIPDFHNTPLRFMALEQAASADSAGRLARAQAELGFAMAHDSIAGTLVNLARAGAIPERIVHNDAKLSNVLLDDATGDALCIVDLDTVMPGLSLYDFGDMVRSMTTTAAEDEPDLTKVTVEPPLFEALARGYLAATGGLLNRTERAHLVLAGKLIVLEQGIRFLTDYLNGDTYYKTQRPDHNLDRCRTQFTLVDALSRHEAELQRIVGGLP